MNTCDSGLRHVSCKLQRVDVPPLILPSALDRGQWLPSRSGRFTQEKKHSVTNKEDGKGPRICPITEQKDNLFFRPERIRGSPVVQPIVQSL